jgi:hypothetical protein
MTLDELRGIADILKNEFEDPIWKKSKKLIRVFDEQGNMYSSINQFKEYQKRNKK